MVPTKGRCKSLKKRKVRLSARTYHQHQNFCNTKKNPREARDLISKIRSCTVRSDLKNKAFSAVFCLFLRSDLAVQDRILEIRSLASLGSCEELIS